MKIDTLCWSCNNRYCSWMRDFTPVEGWNAEKFVRVRFNEPYDSYCVYSCPEFISGGIRLESYDEESVETLRSAIALSACKDYVENLREIDRRKKAIKKRKAEIRELSQQIKVLKGEIEAEKTGIFRADDDNKNIEAFILAREEFCGANSKEVLAALKYGRPNIKLRY